jgi:glutamate-1-semialdehyde 2,1-aminomutase
MAIMKRDTSNQLYEEAQCIVPCGVNSPVRAFRSVGASPFYVQRAKGAYLFDVDGNKYLDYVASWGAIILGHADDGLIEAVKGALSDGTSFGACHPYEVELARMLIDAFPSMELVRLVNSGTEATMSAVRLARGATGRQGIIKFRGCYHGHVDSLLVKAGSGLATFGVPDSAGIPEELARLTYVGEFNHLDTVERIVKEHPDIACCIVEPVMGNMGVILPQKGFLEGLRRICDAHGIILIFDEVITGFRVAYGGAQALYGVRPDMTCLGKIMGGGFPIAAFGGKREIMEKIAPLGPVYQAGTLAGNPIAVRAGIYTLRTLKEKDPYPLLSHKVEQLTGEILDRARAFAIPYRINAITGMFTGFFCTADVTDYDSAVSSDRNLYTLFFQAMLDEGIFFAPSPFEASFLTLSHDEMEFETTLGAYERTFRSMKDRL